MRRRVLILTGLAISTLALYLVFRSIDPGATIEILAATNPLPLLLALFGIAFQMLIRAFRWSHLLPRRHDGERVGLARLVPPLLIGYLANAVLAARLGEPTRAVLVSRREGIGVPEALASVLLERIVDLTTLALTALIVALLVEAPAWIVQIAAVAAALGAAVVAVLATVGVAPLVMSLRRIPIINRPRPLHAALEHVGRFAAALGGGHRRPAILIAIGVSSVAWLVDGATFWLASVSLGIELSYAGAMLIAGITVLGTAVPAAPGYVGTFELAASTVGRALGLPAEAAIALALVAHALTLVPPALGGAASLLIVGTGLGRVVREAELSREAPADPPAGRLEDAR